MRSERLEAAALGSLGPHGARLCMGQAAIEVWEKKTGYEEHMHAHN